MQGLGTGVGTIRIAGGGNGGGGGGRAGGVATEAQQIREIIRLYREMYNAQLNMMRAQDPAVRGSYEMMYNNAAQALSAYTNEAMEAARATREYQRAYAQLEAQLSLAYARSSQRGMQQEIQSTIRAYTELRNAEREY